MTAGEAMALGAASGAGVALLLALVVRQWFRAKEAEWFQHIENMVEASLVADERIRQITEIGERATWADLADWCEKAMGWREALEALSDNEFGLGSFWDTNASRMHDIGAMRNFIRDYVLAALNGEESHGQEA